jgi:hypothetical protein
MKDGSRAETREVGLSVTGHANETSIPVSSAFRSAPSEMPDSNEALIAVKFCNASRKFCVYFATLKRSIPRPFLTQVRHWFRQNQKNWREQH